MYEWIFLLLGLFIGVFLSYLLIRRIYEEKLERWKMEEKETIRKEAVNGSRYGLKGLIWQHVLPLMPSFFKRHNPSDCRFIGDPIDYIIFDNYTKIKDGKDQEAVVTITLVEVKTGESASLKPWQRKIKEAVEDRRIRWETVQIRKKEE